VQPKAGQVRIFDRRRRIQPDQDVAELVQMLRLARGGGVVFVQAFQPLVAKGFDHELS